MIKRIIDKRIKEKFMIDDAYLNGMAKKCGWQATLVYLCLCRHAGKEQESFPSIKLMQEKLGIGRNTVIKGVRSLEKYNIVYIEKERMKNGKWQNNVYVLIDKSQWIGYQVPHKDTAPSPSGDTAESLSEQNQVPVEDIKETHIKETHIKEATETVADSTNELINLFKEINPTYERLYSNTTQRAALQRLVDKFGVEKVSSGIKILSKIINQKYAPRITTPLQLEQKMGELIAFLNQQKSQNNKLLAKISFN